MKISFHTFGCKCNLYDSNQIAAALCSDPFDIVEGDHNADIHVINTCTVTSSADAQARNLIRQIDRKNKQKLIIVMGCSVRGGTESYEKTVKELNINGNRFVIIDNLKEDVAEFIVKEIGDKSIQGNAAIAPVFRTRAFVKITDGCNNFCSYCIVPFVRGRERSRTIDDVVEEIKKLESAQIKEVVLTGISLGDYTFGIEPLIEKILASTSNMRMRISSMRQSKISERLMNLMQEKRLCPHLHVSLQSASDKVLQLMNRTDYTAKSFSKVIKEFYKRTEFRSPFIAADMIVGFPGEGVEEFNQTLRVLNDVPMNKLHVFEFSPRPGTKAFDMKKENDNEVRRRRDILLEFSDKRYQESLQNMIGKTVEVLWETNNQGYSENYYPVVGEGAPNQIQKCKIVSVKDSHLF